MWGKSVCLSALLFLSLGASAHTQPAPSLERIKICEKWLKPERPYDNTTVILDANVIMHDEQALNHFPGAKIVLPAVLLEELDNNKGHLEVGAKVRAFVRQLMYLLKESGASSTFKLDNGSTVVLDPQDHTQAMAALGFQKDKADNTGYLSPALAYKGQGENVLLVTDDFLLTLKAAASGIRTESYRGRADAAVPESADGELPQIEISDEQMQELLQQGRLPKPEGLNLRPNEFVQFFSRSVPASHENVARYIFKRPAPVYDSSSLSATEIQDGEFALDEAPFPDTIRVYLNHDEVPQIRSGESDGWYWDSSENKVTFLGKYKSMLYAQSQVLIEAQIEPHHMERLRSFQELGLWGLQSRSLEQTMALNLSLDPSIDCVVQEGRAGTSKTFNFVVTALKLKESGAIQGTILSRPPAELGGHKSGFLPGDSDEKNLPWMIPFLDNVNSVELAKAESTGAKVKNKVVDLPSGWIIQDYGRIRGRSLAGTLIGVDEFQNTRPNEAETILTRGSTGARYLIMGDVTQVDPPLTPTDNGLATMIAMLQDPQMTPEQQSRVAYIRLRRSVRSPFAKMVSELADRQRAKRRH